MRVILTTIAIVAVLFAASIWWSRSLASSDPSVISRKGIHWHPTLEIYVKGEKLDIPANIGVGPEYAGMSGYGNGGMSMTAMHTHDDMPVIHLEFSRVVREDDIRLGTFFSIWGKDMRSLGSNMRMTVNGQQNVEYGDLIMRDGDKIELRYD